MNQDEECSVTRWIGHLKRGHPDAAHHLWQRYFHRIVGLARAKLGHAPRAVADEEDAGFDRLPQPLRGRYARAVRPAPGSR